MSAARPAAGVGPLDDLERVTTAAVATTSATEPGDFHADELVQDVDGRKKA